MNARQRGSALPAASVLGPNLSARDAASAELRPCTGSASSARSTSSALSVCHAASGASAWRSTPGTSISLVCTGHPLPASYDRDVHSAARALARPGSTRLRRHAGTPPPAKPHAEVAANAVFADLDREGGITDKAAWSPGRGG